MSARDGYAESEGDERTRALLLAAGRFEDVPPIDLARDAAWRLHGRRRVIGNMNELLRVMHHLLCGFSSILGAPPRDDRREDHHG